MMEFDDEFDDDDDDLSIYDLFSLAASCRSCGGMQFKVSVAISCEDAPEERDLGEADGLPDPWSGWSSRLFWCSERICEVRTA